MDFRQFSLADWAIIDLGATSHFLVTAAPVADIIPAQNPLPVTTPNRARVHTTYDCNVAILELPEKARSIHIVPGLASHLLVSVVKLCNAGCKVIFTKSTALLSIVAEWYSQGINASESAYGWYL